MNERKPRAPQNPEKIAQMIVRNIRAFDACCGPEMSGFQKKKICKTCIEYVRRYIVACRWMLYAKTPILSREANTGLRAERAIVHEILNDEDLVGCVFRHLDNPGETFTVHINRSEFVYILKEN